MRPANTSSTQRLLFSNSSPTNLPFPSPHLIRSFYEWQDYPHLGVPSTQRDVFGEPVRTYICTPTAVSQKLCTDAEVGNFLLEGGEGKTIRRQRVDLGMEGIKEERKVVSCSKREGERVRICG